MHMHCCGTHAQAEEAQQQLGEQQRRVLGMVQANEFKARSVENPRLMQRAKNLMPLEAWRTAAREEYELNRQLEPGAATASVDDLVVKAMLKWFKQEFFTWVGRGARRRGVVEGGQENYA